MGWKKSMVIVFMVMIEKKKMEMIKGEDPCLYGPSKRRIMQKVLILLLSILTN